MKPLDGLTVLAISQFGAGPYTSLHLADLGAEIIKIEDPSSKGDISRSVYPYAVNGDSLYFQAFNRNKKSITLNLKSEKGKEIFHRLVKNSDAVFNNLRGDVPEKLGLTYEQLKKFNPAIVTCSLSGFGINGTLKGDPAYDYLFQAMLGHMSLTGSPNGLPQKYGISIIDFATGIMAAFAIMTGIYQSKVKGKGCDIDVTLFDTAASLLNYLAIWHLNKGYVPERTDYSAHPTMVPSQLFPTKDGYIVVMCNKEKFFRKLCKLIGANHLAKDRRFSSFKSRYLNKNELIEVLISIFEANETKYWINKLKGEVPVAPVNSIEEALKDPLIEERNMVVNVVHPTMGNLKMMGTPVKFSDCELDYKPGPTLGCHNEEIYMEYANLSPQEIKDLKAAGVI